MKSNLTEVQSIVGMNLLARLDKMNEQRKSLAHRISSGLADLHQISFQEHILSECHCNHLLPFRFTSEERSRRWLITIFHGNYGIQCATQYYQDNSTSITYSLQGFGHSGFA